MSTFMAFSRWRPTVDEWVIREIENNIRGVLVEQGQVLQVQMARQDDMRITGFALLRAADGDIRTNCTATREALESRTFSWECNPEE